MAWESCSGRTFSGPKCLARRTRGGCTRRPCDHRRTTGGGPQRWADVRPACACLSPSAPGIDASAGIRRLRCSWRPQPSRIRTGWWDGSTRWAGFGSHLEPASEMVPRGELLLHATPRPVPTFPRLAPSKSIAARASTGPVSSGDRRSTGTRPTRPHRAEPMPVGPRGSTSGAPQTVVESAAPTARGRALRAGAPAPASLEGITQGRTR